MKISMVLFCLLTASIVGCRAQTHAEPDEQGTTVRREADAVDPLIADIQGARTAAAEADAIRRLRRYETDHGMTYTIRAFRTFDNSPVDDPSVVRDFVRAEITLYRGRDAIRTFNFVPKDNRNLALLGE